MNPKDFEIVEQALVNHNDAESEKECLCCRAHEALGRLRKELEGKDTPEPTEADLRASYLEGQAKCGLKVGDRVRVTREALNNEAGWDTIWNYAMHDSVGKVMTVSDGRSDRPEWGIRLDNAFYYPYFVLEKVEKKRVPLERKDWAGGPWWVRTKGDRFDGESHLVCFFSGTSFGRPGETFTPAWSVDNLERSTDLVNFEPCYKEIEE